MRKPNFTRLLSSWSSGAIFNLMGIGGILLSAILFFILLGTSLETALESIWPPLVAGLGAVILLVNSFTKSHEGGAIIVRHPHSKKKDVEEDHEDDHDHGHPQPQPRRNPVAVVLGILLYFVFTWPVLNEWWKVAPLAIPTLLVWLAVATIFILSPGKYRPPASLFWSVLGAWGSGFLYWGLFGTSWAGKALEGTAQTGSMSMWIIATAFWITATYVGALVISSRIARQDLVFFNVETAQCKAIKMGSTVMMFIADLTGVPMAQESVPANILARGHEAVWAWMLKDPAKRVDIRPFLTEWGWVGPAFGYFGIPFFTSVEEFGKALLKAGHGHGAHDAHGGHGHAREVFGELRVMPNIDKTLDDPVPAGTSGVEMRLKIGVVLQLCDPFRVFSTPDISHQLEHAVEELNANLARELGTALYGFSGNPHLLEHDVPGLRASTISPATDPIKAVPRIKAIMEEFVHHLNEVGYHVVEVVIKDVNITGEIEDILVERVRTFVRRSVATQQAETLQLVTGGMLKAFMEAAKDHDIDKNKKGEILGDLAKMFFLQGAGGIGGQLGFMVAAGNALNAQNNQTAAGGNAGGGKKGGH